MDGLGFTEPNNKSRGAKEDKGEKIRYVKLKEVLKYIGKL